MPDDATRIRRALAELARVQGGLRGKARDLLGSAISYGLSAATEVAKAK